MKGQPGATEFWPALSTQDQVKSISQIQIAHSMAWLTSAIARDRGMTIVMVTHCQEVADRAERTIHMRDGRVMEDGK